MKKAFFLSFTGFFLAWAITNVTYSQGSIGNAEAKSRLSNKQNPPIFKQFNPATNAPFFRNELNIKAVRHFTREYKTVSDAKWLKSANGESVVYFTNEKIQTEIYYNKRGDYQMTIRHYKEEKLPRDVRHVVRSNYYDFHISYVTEITRDGKVFYGITVEDSISWKVIKVEDYEIEVIGEYFKV